MARVRAEFNDKKLRKNLQTFDSKLRRNINMIFEYNAAYATGWMKQNARWTDRTGAARTGLTATHHSGKEFEELFLAYSVNYGIWLEVANDRKYAILTPALRIMGDKIMRDMTYLIDRMK
jgi:hypothetical protein